MHACMQLACTGTLILQNPGSATLRNPHLRLQSLHLQILDDYVLVVGVSNQEELREENLKIVDTKRIQEWNAARKQQKLCHAPHMLRGGMYHDIPNE